MTSSKSAVASIGIAASLLFAGQAAAADPSKIVIVGGQRYSVTYQDFSYTSNPARFTTQSMPWWGNGALADQFATQIGTALGLPNFGVYGPLFGYDEAGVNVISKFYDDATKTVVDCLATPSCSFKGTTQSYAIAALLPWPSVQPYASIQSVSLDALKNQRELILKTAGECDQVGWLVYDSDKRNDASRRGRHQSLCVFAEAGYATGSINGSDTMGGYSTSNASSAYGIEWKLSKRWSVGAAYGYGTANLGNFQFENTSAYINSNINSASLYGVYRPDKNWKVAALAGYSSFNHTGSRTNIGDIADASFSSNGYTAAIQASYDIILSSDYNNKANPLQPVRVRPLVGIAWGGNQQAGFSETGTGPLLQVQGQAANSLLATVGATFEAPIPLNKSKTTVLTPRVGVAYQRDFLATQDGNTSITASLQGVPVIAFSETGQNRGPDSIYLDLGTDLQINEQVTLYASINYQAFTNGNQLGYQGGIRMKL